MKNLHQDFYKVAFLLTGLSALHVAMANWLGFAVQLIIALFFACLGFAVQRKNKRDEEKREVAARAESFEQFRAACEKKCEEAKNDPEHYGERPVVLDFGNGIKIPVPLKTPGKNWQVGFYEQKEGTILPYLHETDKPEEPDYNIKKESEV